MGGWIARATGILPHLAAGDIHAVAGILRAYWPWTPLASLALLILETVIPPLPAWPVLAANALIYGIWGGIALSWLGGLLGAVVMFCLGRTLGRSALASADTASRMLRSSSRPLPSLTNWSKARAG